MRNTLIATGLGAALLGGIYAAPTVVNEARLAATPQALRLKVPVERILADKVFEEYTEFDMETRKPVAASKRRVVLYAFQTEREVPTPPNELIERRTVNTRTFVHDAEKNQFVQESTLGQKYIRTNDVWYEVGYATTTPEVFDLEARRVGYAVNTAWAADTGFQNPSTTGENNNDWSNPTNAYASDDADAATGAVCSAFQDYGDFGLSVPAGATIDGVEVAIEASDFLSNSSIEVEVSNDNGSTYSTTNNNTGTLTGTDATYNVGGSSTLWGLSWTVADTDNDNFRVRVEAIISDCNADMDHLQSKVYYTEAATPTPKQSEIWF